MALFYVIRSSKDLVTHVILRYEAEAREQGYRKDLAIGGRLLKCLLVFHLGRSFTHKGIQDDG